MILRCVLLLVFFCCILDCKSQNYNINLLGGLPVSKLTDWKAPNYELDLWVSKKIGEKSNLGLGSSYSEINLLSSRTFLTFDWKILSFYTSYLYNIRISEKFDFKPQLRAGYSFVKGKLNEAYDEEKKGSGVYVSGLALISYRLTNAFQIQTGCGYNRTFVKLVPTPKTIPMIYTGSKGVPNQFVIKIGFAYTL